jgi:hypothetical protein
MVSGVSSTSSAHTALATAASPEAQHANEARIKGKHELIEAAAHLLIRWKRHDASWQDDAELKDRIAKKLTWIIGDRGLHGYRERVAVNWVTRHRGAIEERRRSLTKQS